MNKFYYWGPLLYHTKIKNEDITQIENLCIKDNKKDFRKDLAGHIKQEYSIDKDQIVKILNFYLIKYKNTFDHWYNSNLKTITITAAWVNFMKSGEFNPPHIHKNCDLSCVIYLNIPKKLKEENKKYIGTIKGGGPGSIAFSYGEDNNYIINAVNVFPEEGDFFIFPNSLKHFVYPFKSNVERVSVSCNFKISTN
jgi:uncharacterized protein (TIGR02466 family)